MDPNSLQHLPGAAYMQKLEQAAQPQTSFADYDVLTPDEPIWAWQLVKRLLHAPGNILTSHSVQESSNVVETGIQIPAQ
jgi:hypothetical protein